MPREDVLTGTESLDRYAASLSRVVEGKAPKVYQDPETFFSHTYPTMGLTTTVQEVFKRLAGVGSGSPVIKLETGLGGGKTHTLIALYHIANTDGKVSAAQDFLKDIKIPEMKIATFVGTDFGVDALEGERKTLWGELAYQLFGEEGYDLVKASDQNLRAPGEKKLSQLFGTQKCIILLDEMAAYLVKASGVSVGRTSLAAMTVEFLQELTQAASSLDNVSVVITSLNRETVFKERTRELEEAIKKAVSEVEARRSLDDADEVLSRIVRNLTPTKGEEFSSIIRYRLFESVDEEKAQAVCEAYYLEMRQEGVKEFLPHYTREPSYKEALLTCYPFHPEFINMLRTKTGSITAFNKTRGVLRLLGQLLSTLWKDLGRDVTLIGSGAIDFGSQLFVDELVKRLDKGEYMPAIDGDLYNKAGSARAGLVDKAFGDGLGTKIATAIFLNSLTGVVGADIKRGINEREIALAVFEPGLDLERTVKATEMLEEKCFYLMKHGSTLSFYTEPNLNKIIDKYERDVRGSTAIIQELEDRIRKIYGGKKFFSPCIFANKPADVPDDTNNPKLIVLHFNDCKSKTRAYKPPKEIRELFNRQGTMGSPRIYSNNLVFLVADENEVRNMLGSAERYVSLKRLFKDYNQNAPSLASLSRSQVETIKEKLQKSELYLKIAVVVAYRHLFVPSHQTSITDEEQYKKEGLLDKPQKQMTMSVTESEAKNYHEQKKQQDEVIVEYLRANGKARTMDDKPITPDYVLNSIWPRTREELTGDEFRKEFYKNPQADIIFSDDLIMKSMKNGIKEGRWYAVLEEVVFDKSDVHFPGGMTSSVQLVLVSSPTGKNLKKEFYCGKCGKKRRSCSCEKLCEKCGKLVSECICTGEIIVDVTACFECGKEKYSCRCHFPSLKTTITTENAKLERIVTTLEAKLKEVEFEKVDRVAFMVGNRGGLIRLANAAPQFPNAELSFNLKGVISKEYDGGNHFEFRYRGDLRGYNAAKSVIANYEGQAEFNSHDLVVAVEFSEPKTPEQLAALLGQKIALYTQDSLYKLTIRKAQEDD